MSESPPILAPSRREGPFFEDLDGRPDEGMRPLDEIFHVD